MGLGINRVKAGYKENKDYVEEKVSEHGRTVRILQFEPSFVYY